jgi:hypothetical protein
MSLLQLAGGVAVAGVVAAGSTAFTATGISKGANATNGFVGGSVSQSVDGGVVTATTYILTNNDVTKLASVRLTTTGVPTTATVKVVPAGGSWTGGTAPTQFLCAWNAGQTRWDCSPADASNAAEGSAVYDATSMTGVTISIV